MPKQEKRESTDTEIIYGLIDDPQTNLQIEQDLTISPIEREPESYEEAVNSGENRL